MLQEIIQQLEQEKQYLHDFTKGGIDIAITHIRSKLPEFEEAIKKAYNEGSLATYKKEPQNGQAQDYYNQTYKK